MPRIKFLPHAEICPEGAEIEVEPGTTICDAALANGIEIEHACEKSCACTTCHVVVREGYDSLPEPSEEEEDLLDKAWGLEPESRLSCQAKVDHEDLVVEIPRYTINLVSERHLFNCRYLPGALNMKWTDTRDIAIALAESHPDLDPMTLSFPKLMELVMGLDDFDDTKEHCGEKILESIQMTWIDEAD